MKLFYRNFLPPANDDWARRVCPTTGLEEFVPRLGSEFRKKLFPVTNLRGSHNNDFLLLAPFLKMSKGGYNKGRKSQLHSRASCSVHTCRRTDPPMRCAIKEGACGPPKRPRQPFELLISYQRCTTEHVTQLRMRFRIEETTRLPYQRNKIRSQTRRPRMAVDRLFILVYFFLKFPGRRCPTAGLRSGRKGWCCASEHHIQEAIRKPLVPEDQQVCA